MCRFQLLAQHGGAVGSSQLVHRPHLSLASRNKRGIIQCAAVASRASCHPLGSLCACSNPPHRWSVMHKFGRLAAVAAAVQSDRVIEHSEADQEPVEQVSCRRGARELPQRGMARR